MICYLYVFCYNHLNVRERKRETERDRERERERERAECYALIGFFNWVFVLISVLWYLLVHCLAYEL